MELIKRSCGFLNGIDVSVIGSKGGLSLGWKEDVKIQLKSFSNSHIDVEVTNDDSTNWHFTGFYDAPIESRRRDLWNLLRQLKVSSELTWLVMGDFNEILFSFEKKGSRLREERQMRDFREVLEECDLCDLGLSSSWFTWERGRLSSNNIRERLDRGVANSLWWEKFPTFSIQHQNHSISNHCPIVLSFQSRLKDGYQNRRALFQFNAN